MYVKVIRTRRPGLALFSGCRTWTSSSESKLSLDSWSLVAREYWILSRVLDIVAIFDFWRETTNKDDYKKKRNSQDWGNGKGSLQKRYFQTSQPCCKHVQEDGSRTHAWRRRTEDTGMQTHRLFHLNWQLPSACVSWYYILAYKPPGKAYIANHKYRSMPYMSIRVMISRPSR